MATTPEPERPRIVTLVGIAAGAFVSGLVAGATVAFLYVRSAAKIVVVVERPACDARLSAIHKGLVLYKVSRGSLPEESGAAFLRCVASAGLRDPIEQVDGPDPAYFGRDMERFPIERFPRDGSEPLAACDKDALEHHPDVTHVLYADGSVKALSLAELKAQGLVPPETQRLAVGPGSPVEDLRKLRSF